MENINNINLLAEVNYNNYLEYILLIFSITIPYLPPKQLARTARTCSRMNAECSAQLRKYKKLYQKYKPKFAKKLYSYLLGNNLKILGHRSIFVKSDKIYIYPKDNIEIAVWHKQYLPNYTPCVISNISIIFTHPISAIIKLVFQNCIFFIREMKTTVDSLGRYLINLPFPNLYNPLPLNLLGREYLFALSLGTTRDDIIDFNNIDIYSAIDYLQFRYTKIDETKLDRSSNNWPLIDYSVSKLYINYDRWRTRTIITMAKQYEKRRINSTDFMKKMIEGFTWLYNMDYEVDLSIVTDFRYKCYSGYINEKLRPNKSILDI